MLAAGRKLSQASKYSWVAAGPPCRSSNFAVGLLPTRLVQTWKSPLDVVIGIRRAPPPRMSSRPVLSRYSSAFIDSPRNVASACPRPTGYRLGPGLPRVAAIAASELRHGFGDALLQVQIKELSLRDVDRDVDVPAHLPPSDPGWDAIGDHLAADVDAHQLVVLRGHVDADLEHQARVLHEPPAPLPAKAPVLISREMDGIIGHHPLAFACRCFQLRSDVSVELARDPVDQRRGAVVEIRPAVRIGGERPDRPHGTRVTAAVRGPLDDRAVVRTEGHRAEVPPTIAVLAAQSVCVRASGHGAIDAGGLGFQRHGQGFPAPAPKEAGHRRNSTKDPSYPAIPRRIVDDASSTAFARRPRRR